MVKPRTLSKKGTAYKSFKKYARQARTKAGALKKYKTPYSKKRFTRVVKSKSSKHSVFCQFLTRALGDDLNADQAQLNAGIDQLTGVMRGFLLKDPNMFHVDVSTYVLPLGSADALTIGPSIMSAIQVKYRRYNVGIRSGDEPVLAPVPHINYHGVSIKFMNTVKSTNDTNSTTVSIPMLYYQANDSYGVRVIPIMGSQIYLKFPKTNDNINGVATIVRNWPRHLCVFNTKYVRVKVYYSLSKSKSQGAPNAFAQNMNLDVANI